jgi:hypothetical protein
VAPSALSVAAQCPLLAQSGHAARDTECPLSGVKRTLRAANQSLLGRDDQRRWKADANRLRRLGVDQQRELRGLLDREVCCWLLTLDDAMFLKIRE